MDEAIEETMVFANDNVVLSPSDRIAVFGYSDTIPPKAFIADLGADGTLAWKRTLDDIPTDSRAYALAADSDGNWILGGDILTKSLPTGNDTPPVIFFEGFLRKYSPMGDEKWTQTIPAADGDHSIHVTAVQTTSENQILTLWNTTRPFVGSGTHMSVGKRDTGGAMVSQTVIPIEEYSVGGEELIAGPGGDFFITGTISPGDPNGIPLVGFASRHTDNGSTRWTYQNEIVARSSNFMAIALAAPGYLYLAGIQGIAPSPETRILLCLIRQ